MSENYLNTALDENLKKKPSRKCPMKQPPHKCPQSSAEKPNGGDERVDFSLASVVSPFLALGPASPLTAAMFGLHKTSPGPSSAACLQPPLDSIRTQKHPANTATVSGTEMPREKAGRQLMLESGTVALPGCGPSMGSPLSHRRFGLHFPLLLTPSIHIFSPRKGVKERLSLQPKNSFQMQMKAFFFF